MIADTITLIEFLKKHWDEYKIISALFNADGQRTEGEKKIEVQIVSVGETKDKWFYRVKPLDSYVFVYFPVIPTVYVDYGQLVGKQNPDSNIFRFVGNEFSAVISGGNPNVRTDFIVVGYKPKDLLSRKKNS